MTHATRHNRATRRAGGGAPQPHTHTAQCGEPTLVATTPGLGTLLYFIGSYEIPATRDADARPLLVLTYSLYSAGRMCAARRIMGGSRVHDAFDAD